MADPVKFTVLRAHWGDKEDSKEGTVRHRYKAGETRTFPAATGEVEALLRTRILREPDVSSPASSPAK